MAAWSVTNPDPSSIRDNLRIARDSNRHPGEVAWRSHKNKPGLIMFDPDMEPEKYQF